MHGHLASFLHLGVRGGKLEEFLSKVHLRGDSSAIRSSGNEQALTTYAVGAETGSDHDNLGIAGVRLLVDWGVSKVPVIASLWIRSAGGFHRADEQRHPRRRDCLVERKGRV